MPELVDGTYVTQPGDTAYSVAIALIHRGEAWKYLAIVNPNLFGDPANWNNAANTPLPVGVTINLPVDMRDVIGSQFKLLFRNMINGVSVVDLSQSPGTPPPSPIVGGAGAGSGGTTRRINPFPPTFHEDPAGDTAKYVIPLGQFLRPRLYIVNGEEFEWPLGTEEIGVLGAAQVAEHKYLGDNAVVVEVTHLDTSRIEMSGLFPGKTGPDNMRALRRMCRVPNPVDFKRLEVPGVFTQAQRVVCESYDFRRVPEDAFSWTYTINMIVVGTSPIASPANTGLATAPTSLPSAGKQARGKPAHTLTVKDGQQTLKSLAKAAYGNPDKWRILYQLNREILQDAIGQVPLVQASTTLLPLGTEIQYLVSGGR